MELPRVEQLTSATGFSLVIIAVFKCLECIIYFFFFLPDLLKGQQGTAILFNFPGKYMKSKPINLTCPKEGLGVMLIKCTECYKSLEISPSLILFIYEVSFLYSYNFTGKQEVQIEYHVWENRSTCSI